MQTTGDKLQVLLEDINNKIDELLIKLESQQKEISFLRLKNVELKENSVRNLKKIEEYVCQLEQIKNEYIASKYNVKS